MLSPWPLSATDVVKDLSSETLPTMTAMLPKAFLTTVIARTWNKDVSLDVLLCPLFSLFAHFALLPGTGRRPAYHSQA
ncbi:hypothetical protein Ciccas_002128 [Cichlidogyrus casuarinus]|uniref:Uncharacterized protein n=1 Tax=Cichlidogyrus casuarinus TaxID=1844966 RepID=A0ABD2QI43_9PLAT